MTDTKTPSGAVKPPMEEAERRAQEVVRDRAVAPEKGGVRGLFARANNWGELRNTPHGIGPVLLLSWAVFFVGLSDYLFTLSAVPVIQDLDVSIPTVIGYLTLSGTAVIVATLAVAYWADRHRRVPLFGIGMIVGGLVHALTGRARSGLSFGAPVVGSAAALEASDTPVGSLLADYYPPGHRGKAYALYGFIAGIGAAVSPVLAGQLIEAYGWRTAYVVLSVPMVLVGVVTLLWLREPVRGYMERRELGAGEEVARTADEPPSFAEAWRTIWAIRTLRRIFIAQLFTTAGTRVFGITAIIFFLPRQYQLTPLELGYMLSAAFVFAVPGYYLGGGLVDWLFKRRPSQVLIVPGVFSILSVVGPLVLLFKPPLWIFVVAQGVVFFGESLTGPTLSAFYAQIVPSHTRTLGVAVRGLSRLPGRVIATPLLGVIIAAYNVESGFIFSIPLFVVGAIVFITAAPFFEVDMRSAFATTLAREQWRKAKEEGRSKLLVCRDIDVAYDGVQVLFGVDFDVDEGEIVALLGTNGAGKSTLLRAISGSQQASSGGVVFDGRDITAMPPNETATRGVVLMPGGRGVFPGLSVRENLLLGNWNTEDPAEVSSRLAEVFEVFPVLADRVDVNAGLLSGGEQQMLSLAQAFLSRPKLLMIDELSLGLSPAVVGELLDVVRRIHERGVTIIVVEQSVNIALAIADRAIFMEKGEVKFVGPTADLLRRPDILRAVYVKGTGGLTEAAGRTAGADRRRHELEQARPVLEVQGIVKRYGGLTALAGVSLTLRESEVLGVIGPNGSGKTTLFDVISGFQPADAGVVRYQGVDITDLSADQRARRKLVRRFQDARLFPSLTVFENLLIALDQRLEVRSTVLNAVALPQARQAERRGRQRAERLIELFELGAYRDKFVKELSTGLRRIVDLACVIATEPSVLLLDEPSSGIAQAEAEALGPLLRRVRFETGCSILVIEHDMPLISAISDELIALDQGEVMLQGPPEVVLDDERVIQAYLGGSEEAVRRSGSLA